MTINEIKQFVNLISDKEKKEHQQQIVENACDKIHKIYVPTGGVKYDKKSNSK